MKNFNFLEDFGRERSRMKNFWKLECHEIPSSSGVYLLVAKAGIEFQYPEGKSPIYYIGKADSLRRRLLQHLKLHLEVKSRNVEEEDFLNRPRHEYGAVFGGGYCFIKTWSGMTPKNLEDEVLALFAKKYRSFPVANSAGAWNRIEKVFEKIK
jgi:hypothetical protein